MIDFDSIRNDVYAGIEKTNSVKKVFIKTKLKSGYPSKKELWKIIVEIPVNGIAKEFIFFINLLTDFPISLPKIYLSEQDYEKNKFIPHVDSNRLICLFDVVNIKIDIERPLEILKNCIDRAINIISDGLNSRNAVDFADEIIAYWENTYHVNDKVVSCYTGEGIENLNIGKVNLQYLHPSYNNINLLLLPHTRNNDKLLAFFKRRGHQLDEKTGFYLGEIKEIEPPFYYNNKTTLEFIKNHFPSLLIEITKYINQLRDIGVLIFSLRVKDQLIFFGFYLEKIQLNQNGWRSKSLTPVQVMSTSQGNQSVTRLRFEEFDSKRLIMRTDGIFSEEQSYKFTIAGLGSIGSNLVHYLNALNVSSFDLIDPEVLKLENINRHLLSYADVGYYKVDVVEKYLMFHNPFLNIKTHKSSVTSVIKYDLNSINESDFIFCIVGKDSVENYLLQCLSSQVIAKPIIFLWVEPYLLGGHILYINPATDFTLSQLEIEGYYKYNIISSATYLNKKKDLLLKEAGCQGSYIPYGKQSINEFFSIIIPEVYDVIKNKNSQNFVLTYVGNLSIAEKLDLEISDYAKQIDNKILKQII